jgi:hypothetical protein
MGVAINFKKFIKMALILSAKRAINDTSKKAAKIPVMIAISIKAYD